MRKNLNNNIDNYADLMLNKLVGIIDTKLKNVPRLKTAIVFSVNENKTVNVTLPGDGEKVYTNIQNQSIYQNLIPGDIVKLLLEDGSFSNCWIIARYPRQGGNETDVVSNNIGI